MELNESIRSRAYRCLRPIKNFQSAEQAVGNLPDEVQSRMLPDEELLGIYINSDSDPNANLVFTTRGVYHFALHWGCAEYRRIEKVKVPGWGNHDFDKSRANLLVLHDDEGWEMKLTISGAVTKMVSDYERRFPDLWEVLRYLSRVIARVRQDQAAKSAHDSPDADG